VLCNCRECAVELDKWARNRPTIALELIAAVEESARVTNQLSLLADVLRVTERSELVRMARALREEVDGQRALVARLRSDVMGEQAKHLAREHELGAPIPLRLTCPACGTLHVDEGEFATKRHHTHACQGCGMVWRPAKADTVGVRFLPGYKNDETAPTARTMQTELPLHSEDGIEE
jgi:rubredoxin